MKLLFRAKKENVIKFIIYCVFLLFLIAIAVLNIHSFATEGYFWGLNPLPAFGPDFLVATIVFYLIALVASILSVSSFFITRDSGIGFAGEKNDPDGFEKMADEKAVKTWKDIEKVVLRDKEYKAGGVPFLLNSKEAYVNNGEDHTIIIGSTGSGKTECGILPTARILAKAGESMIITDPKGEIYQKIGALLKEQGYKIVLLNFRDPQRGNSWNPFSLPYNFYKEGKEKNDSNKSDKSMELLEDLGANILTDPNSKANDPFWENASKDYFTALSMGLFEDAPEDAININSINLMVTQGDHKFGRNSYYDKEYFALKGEDTPIYNKASAVINTAQDTKAGVLSTFRTKTGIFSSRTALSEMLARSDFDMSTIGREKTAVFMTIHDEKKTYHALLTIFVKQVYESLIDEAFKCEGGRLPIRTNFLLDEFANMPALKDVDSMITASRSRNIRFTFIIQNFSQLNQVYGADMAETIKGNCNIHFLLTTELKALEEISKLCGDKKPKKPKEGEVGEPIRPLVTVSDLQHMKKFEFLIKRMRFSPFKTIFTPDFQLKNENAWNCSYETLAFPQREFKAPSTFDLIEFVNKKKEEAGEPVPGAMGGVNPFGGMGNPFASMGASGFNPFMPSPSSTTSSMPSGSSSINFEELSKKIDERIAELEKEEQMEREAKEKENASVNVNLQVPESTVTLEPKPVDIDFEVPETRIDLEPKPVDVNVRLPEMEPVKPTLETPPVQVNVQMPTSEPVQVTPEPVPINVNVQVPESNVTVKEPQVITSEPAQSINVNINIPHTQLEPVKEDTLESPEVDTTIEKPKVNVDADSIIVNDNITDDEFFDDFFDEE